MSQPIKSTVYTIFNFIAALVLSYLWLVLMTDLKFPSRWSYLQWTVFSLSVLGLNYFLTRCKCRALPFLFPKSLKRIC